MRRRALLALLLALALVTPASGAYKIATAHITSQTTTTLVAAVAGKKIDVYAYSFCVDGNGATTALTLQDSGSTNLLGTGMVYIINPGQCMREELRPNIAPRYQVGSGLGLQLVTGTGNGPVEALVEFLQP